MYYDPDENQGRPSTPRDPGVTLPEIVVYVATAIGALAVFLDLFIWRA